MRNIPLGHDMRSIIVDDEDLVFQFTRNKCFVAIAILDESSSARKGVWDTNISQSLYRHAATLKVV